MDASDTIRKRKAKSYFNQKKEEFAKLSGQECCDGVSACGTACFRKFTSYNEKHLYVVGKNLQNGTVCEK